MHIDERLAPLEVVHTPRAAQDATPTDTDMLCLSRLDATIDDGPLVNEERLVGMQGDESHLVLAWSIVNNAVARGRLLGRKVGKDKEIVLAVSIKLHTHLLPRVQTETHCMPVHAFGLNPIGRGADLHFAERRSPTLHLHLHAIASPNIEAFGEHSHAHQRAHSTQRVRAVVAPVTVLATTFEARYQRTHHPGGPPLSASRAHTHFIVRQTDALAFAQRRVIHRRPLLRP